LYIDAQPDVCNNLVYLSTDIEDYEEYEECSAYLVHVNDTLVGFTAFEYDNAYHALCIKLLCAHNQICTGIGSLLLQKVEEYSRQNHIPRIYLESLESSKGFYTHMGYLQIDPDLDLYEKDII
jgi:N-acetylglutamate synthase-like GNAT family acetyltransferase